MLEAVSVVTDVALAVPRAAGRRSAGTRERRLFRRENVREHAREAHSHGYALFISKTVL